MQKEKKIPLRKCVACQEMRPKKELLRVVRTLGQEVIIDATGKRSGRGAYLCRNEECLLLAKKKHALERALDVKVSTDIYDQLYEEMGVPSPFLKRPGVFDRET